MDFKKQGKTTVKHYFSTNFSTRPAQSPFDSQWIYTWLWRARNWRRGREV